MGSLLTKTLGWTIPQELLQKKRYSDNNCTERELLFRCIIKKERKMLFYVQFDPYKSIDIFLYSNFKRFLLGFFFIIKAKYIQEKIGYQDFILNTTALDEYYENVSEMISEFFVFSK